MHTLRLVQTYETLPFDIEIVQKYWKDGGRGGGCTGGIGNGMKEHLAPTYAGILAMVSMDGKDAEKIDR